MPENKITFGLENVHIAILGVSQVESIEVTAGCTTDGEIAVQVSSAAVTGSPVSVVVPLAAETHSTAAKVASAIANALNNNAAISAAFLVRASGAVIYLIAKVVAANDATLAIAVTVGSTGVTVGTSTNVTAGATGWGTPRAVPGAVDFSPKAQGKESTFYADNGIYFTSTSNNGYTADLEIALIPDDLLAEIMGWLTDSNGAIIEIANAIPKHFALMGQVCGDAKNRRFVYYDCLAARPEKSHKTKGESIDPATDKLALTIAPIQLPIGGETKTVVKGTMELSTTNVTAFNNFFNSVYMPVVA